MAETDVISRQALRDAMYHQAFETDTEMQRWDSGCWIRYKLFENVIENLPSAERVGKWLHPYSSDIACECSVCHMQMPITDWFNFCPHCGARMEGEEE